MSFTVVEANTNHLAVVSELFDAYRVFYEQTSDVQRAQEFLKDRLLQNECVIFLAFKEETPVGFTQLYKTFSSVTMQPFYILNDLFVKPEYRGQCAGKQLLETAKQFCLKKGFKGLALETANDNPAQKLYEKLGWVKDSDFLHYFWKAQKS